LPSGGGLEFTVPAHTNRRLVAP